MGRLARGALVALVLLAPQASSAGVARADEPTTVDWRRTAPLSGTVVGDVTAGAVMLARTHVMMGSRGHQFVPYAVSITEAAVELPNGDRLEKTGVTPDVLVLPSAEDLRAGRDPVLALAVALAGGTLSPEAAGRLFAEPAPHN